ncbi:MauE/DoxX family redox-associated membrane protein [Mucilaginibacter sp.]
MKRIHLAQKPGIKWEELLSFCLIVLFVYTASSKLVDFNQFKVAMYGQTLPHEVAALLVWLLPIVEITVSLLLLFEKTRLAGFYASLILMTLFSGYISLVLFHYFGRVPCSCGGVIKALGWRLHLVFNLFFLLLSLLGIYVINRERRMPDK